MHSNKYTLIFTSIITISLGFVLSYAATSLKPRQDVNVEIDIKKNILTALGIKPQKSEKWTIEEVQEVYEKSINGIVLNTKGEKTEKEWSQVLEVNALHRQIYACSIGSFSF